MGLTLDGLNAAVKIADALRNLEPIERRLAIDCVTCWLATEGADRHGLKEALDELHDEIDKAASSAKSKG